MGEHGWVQKVVLWWEVFPSPGGCLRANVSDGANVRCRSEASAVARYVTVLFAGKEI